MRYGTIIGVSVRKDRVTNKPKGFAFVSFATPEAGPDAIKSMNGYIYGGRSLTVNVADKRGRKDDDESDGDHETSEGGSGCDSVARAEGTSTSRRINDSSWKTAPDPLRSSKEKKVGKSNSWTKWAGPS